MDGTGRPRLSSSTQVWWQLEFRLRSMAAKQWGAEIFGRKTLGLHPREVITNTRHLLSKYAEDQFNRQCAELLRMLGYEFKPEAGHDEYFVSNASRTGSTESIEIAKQVVRGLQMMKADKRTIRYRQDGSATSVRPGGPTLPPAFYEAYKYAGSR